MKKLSLFLMAILAFGLTSCDEAFVEPTPQFNPQEPVLSNYGLTVQIGAGISAPLDLNVVEGEIEVIKTASTDPVLEGAQTVEYIAYLSNSDKFTDKITFDVVDGKLSTSDINAAFRSLYGKASKPKEIFIQFAAFLADGTSRVRYGDVNSYFGQTKVMVTATPVPPGEPFIYLVGNANGWDINSDKCALASTDGDDIFVGTFDLMNNGDNNFRFYSKLGNWDEGSIGSQKDDQPIDITSKLVNDYFKGDVVDGKGGFKLTVDGTYKITVNLNTYTMTMEKKPEDPSQWSYIYMVGDINGWKLTSEAKQGEMICKTKDDIYSATFTLPDSGDGTSSFRFVTKLDGTWDSKIGTDSGAEEIPEFDGGIAMALVIAGNEGSFRVPAGTYKVDIDLKESILVLTQLAE